MQLCLIDERRLDPSSFKIKRAAEAAPVETI
jgi:hypothetical protein